MANLFELVNRLAVLLAARRPEWVEQTAYTGAPSGDVGVALQDAPRTRVVVDVREDAGGRTARIRIDTLDLAATYTVTVDGNAVSYDASAASPAPADAADVLEDLAAAINADGTVGALVNAEALDEDGDGTVDTVRLRGLGEADYSIAVSATGGAALTCEADPASCSARVWLSARGTGALPPGWRVPNGGELGEITRRGFDERLGTGGCSRAYVEIHSITGVSSDGAGVTYVPRVFVGPGVAE